MSKTTSTRSENRKYSNVKKPSKFLIGFHLKGLNEKEKIFFIIFLSNDFFS